MAAKSLIGPGALWATMALTALAVAVGGCGGQGANKSSVFGDAAVGDRVTVEGTVSLRGSTPHTIVMLEMTNGGVVVLQSSSLQSELRSLAGMTVSVEGKLLPAIDEESPLIDAQSYRLLALPTGEVPMVGTLSLRDGQCFLKADDGEVYWIRGEFEATMKSYDGARVWVVGSAKGDYPQTPENTTPLQVTGYGILSTE